MVALLLASCAKVPSSTRPAEHGAEWVDRVTVADADVRRWLRVATWNAAVDNGAFRVRLELLNQSPKDQVVQVRVRFRDAAELPLADETPWMVVTLPAHTSSVVMARATDAAARHFSATVRPYAP